MDLGFTWKNEINLVHAKKITLRKGPYAKKKKEIPKPKIKNDKFMGFQFVGYNKLFCEACQCFIQKRIKSQHVKTSKHKDNLN